MWEIFPAPPFGMKSVQASEPICDSEFRKYLTKENIPFTEPQIQSDLPWIKWHIKREVFTSVFGLNAGYQVELTDDPQVAKAVELIPQAKALYETARKTLAERAGNNTVPAGQPK